MLPSAEMLGFWGSFKIQIKLILKIVKNECLKVIKEDALLEGLKNLMIHMETTITANINCVENNLRMKILE